MPFEVIGKYRIVFTDYNLKDKVWPMITDWYINRYDSRPTTDTVEISNRLKFLFQKLIYLFRIHIQSIPSASFFMFIHLNNDNLNSLYFDQLKGFNINGSQISESDLALHRKVYKIILEQFVKYPLTHEEFIEVEIKENEDQYESYLECILYLGIQIYQFSGFIAENDLFPGSINIPKIEDSFNLNYDGKYNILLDHSLRDLHRHQFRVKVINIVPELIALVKTTMNVDYGKAIGVLSENSPIADFSYYKLEQNLNLIAEEIESDVIGLKKFYDGLTLTKTNVLTIEDSFLRSQLNNRYTYRPLLELEINGMKVIKSSENKIHESIITLTTNSFQYGHIAPEWKEYKPFRKLLGRLASTRDLILQKPMVDMINSFGIHNDQSVKSLLTDNKAQNFNIVKFGPGEIDIIFVVETEDTNLLYICECKNNRFRSDIYNWRRDYANFVEKYETQLSNKVKWVESNTESILTHIRHKNKLSQTHFDHKTTTVKGIYLINAPTIYMYDGIFDVYTLTSFQELLSGRFDRMIYELKDEDSGEVSRITYPYFRNIGIKKKWETLHNK